MTPNQKPNRRRDIGFYVLILVILLSVIFILTSQNKSSSELTFSEVETLFEKEQVESFVVEGDKLFLQLRSEYNGSKVCTYRMLDLGLFYDSLRDTIQAQRASGVLKEYDYTPGWTPPWWLSILPYVIVMILFMVIWYVMMNRAGAGADRTAMRFGKARTQVASDDKKKVTFADVAGADEEKAELQEIVDFLKNPQKYLKLGARIPKGVLLVGPPGTGKTLIAKAVAGEANVQFLSISGSDFVELYVGVGASRVRDLFEQAKKVAPSIVFIDEIDAVGRQRGTGLGGGHDEREQTLNQLLVEMDGFSNNEGIIVMAATNRADILDSAVLRPGRFDRRVYVGLPDIKGREEILKVHARNKALGDDVNLKDVAKDTPGFTGADLENLLNEAALLAARRNKLFITMAELEEATLKVEMGPEKKSRVVTEKERRLTAYHEAGHAVAAYFLDNADPVHHITIIPRGGAGGMTVYRPLEDKSFHSRNEMFDRIVTALGGRVAESLMLDDISTGAAGDIQQASSIARAMVMQYGMSDRLGPISFDSSDHSVFIGRDFAQTKSYSEETAAAIDSEVKRIFDEAQARCRGILTEHRQLLIATAEYLLQHESMDGETFRRLLEHDGEIPAPEEKDVPVEQDAPVLEAAPQVPADAPVPEAEAESPAGSVTEEQDGS